MKINNLVVLLSASGV